MKSYRYEFFLDGKRNRGKIKALNYESAFTEVKKKFHNEELIALRVYDHENLLKNFLNIFFGDLRAILTKFVPIAIGIIIVYLLLYYYA